MSSPFRRNEAIAMLLAALLAAAGCDREHRDYRGSPLPETGLKADELASNDRRRTPLPDVRSDHYQRSAWHIAQGAHYYRWFNCNGCHAAGGGGMGPALMDGAWRYGGSMEEIVATIREGRPNGMPAFGGKIPDQQVWQIAAYVRALSGNAPMDAVPGRSDALSAIPPLTQVPQLHPDGADPSADRDRRDHRPADRARPHHGPGEDDR